MVHQEILEEIHEDDKTSSAAASDDAKHGSMVLIVAKDEHAAKMVRDYIKYASSLPETEDPDDDAAPSDKVHSPSFGHFKV